MFIANRVENRRNIRQCTMVYVYSVLVDLMNFLKNAIVRYADQVELFVKAGGIESLLDVLTVFIRWLRLSIE